MMLFGHVEQKEGCEEYMFDAQPTLQLAFLLIAVLCIPVMLLGKPLHIKFSKKHAPTTPRVINLKGPINGLTHDNPKFLE